MKNFYRYCKSFVIALICSVPFMTQAQLNVSSSASAQDLANAILGSGVSVSNVVLDCGPGGSGTFSNGGTTNIGLNEGILLTSGRASDAIGPNDNGGLTFNQDAAYNGDADLSTLVGGSIQDACRLEFDFVAESDFITVQYVFGSEEYNEYVCSQFNDVFGFFVTGNKPAGGSYNGENVALVPSTTLPVSVNTINNGSAGSQGNNSNCVSLLYSAYYQNNAGGLSIQYDGFTVVLTAEVAVIPGETYHFKFAIADVADSNLDSGVFIKGSSFSIFNCQAGILSLNEGSLANICSTDDIADVVSVSSNSTATGDEYSFLLTDVAGNILAINTTGTFDLSSFPNGDYIIYGISVDGIVSGIEIGENLIDITVAEDEGCYDLSNGVAIRKEACLTFELISCADDITLECGSNLEDYTITGSPNLLIENQGDAVVSLTHVDVISEVGDCGYIVTRTWIASIAGGPSVTCTQIITIEDTTGPVISGVEPVINVQCLEEVPAPVEASASDACTSASAVTTFTSQTGEITETCVLSTAFGPGADWAVWLPTLSQASSANYVFDSNGGYFDQFLDGTAHIYGTVQNTNNANEKFVVDMWLQAKRDWSQWSALGRSYKDDLGLAQPDKFLNWSYYELADGFSTLTGAGDFAGDVLYIYHMPANYYFGFQVGLAANNKNANYGLSGWFTYDGFVGGESVEGHGDINVDASCEPVFDNDCVHNTSFTHFYRATDACGNATIVSQTVNVEDITAPTFDNCPQSLTIECDQPVPAVAEGVTASDNCVGDVTVLYLGEEEEGNACSRTITRTWSATDICGNRADCVQTITIVDTTAPVLSGTPDAEITVECDAVPAAAQVSAIDACQGEVEVGYTEEVIPGNCPGNYTLIRTWSAYDSCENGSSFTQTINVQDTTAPTFDPYDFYTHIECNEIPDLITASDNCGTASVVLVSEVLNSGGCLGVYYRVYEATDLCGNKATAEQYIAIQDNTAPELVGVPADETIECSEVSLGENGNYFDNGGVYGVDNCGLDVVVTYSEEVVATDDNCPQSFDIIRTWVAVDYCENESSATQIVHVVDTTAPSVYAPENTQFSCEEEMIFADASAEDNCGLATISEVRDTVNYDCAQNFDIVRTFTAVDECGNISEPVQQIIEIRDYSAPVFEEQQSQYSYECDETIPSIQPVASDNCSEVTYSSIDTLHYNSACYSSFYRVWTATDACGNSSEFYQFIEIRDTTAPVISGEFEISRPCDDFMGTYVTAEDNCNEFEITFTDEHVSGSCAGKVIRRYVATDICENSSIEFTQFIILVDTIAPEIVSETEDFTVECGDEFGVNPPQFSDNCDEELDIFDEVNSETDGCTTWITYSWTAVDHCNNSVTSSTVVTIVDTTDPYFTSFPENETISCEDEVPAVVYPTAADNCDENVDIELAIVEVPGSCPNERTINRTFRAYDNCGNEVVETQVITIVDETAPVFGEQNASFSYECNTEIPVVYPSASDNCGEVTLSYVDSLYLDSECLDIIIRTWTAVDECENASNFVQSINIVDTTAPVIAGDFEISRPCDDYMGIYVTAQDNCNNLEITFYDEEVSGSCAGKVIRHYTATDLCENSSEEFLQYIILTDEVAPVIESETADFTVECGDEYGVEAPVFSDNCDDELVITSDVDSQFDGCTTTVTYSWTATDHCDNATTSITVVTIVDTTDPYFTSFPEDQTISCEDELPAVVYPTAADNCDEQVEIELSIEEVPGVCANERTINRTFRAIDNCGNDVVETQVITIIDETAPVFGEQVTEFTYECNEEIPVIEPSATDNCGEVSYSHVDSEIMNAIDVIEGYDGEGIYLDLTAYSGTVNLTITTSQESGIFHYINIPGVDYIAENAGTVTYPLEGGRIYGPCTAPNGTLYIGSETPVGGINLVIVEEGGDDWNDMVLTVDQGFFARYDFDPSTASICDKFFTRTWTASDECGNESVLVQTIFIVDTTAPVVDAYEIEISMPCDQISNQVLISATDNCNEVIITFEDEQVSGTCEGKIIRTYHVSDICGNVTEGIIQQIITLTDAVAPSVEVAPADVTVECGDETPAYTPVWSDNCANVEDLTLNYVTDVQFDGCTTTITEIWTATDNCDNTGSVTRIVSIVDTTDPEFTFVPEAVYADCQDQIAFVAAEASDICDEEVTITSNDVIVPGSCPSNYTIERTYTATDDCGNFATATTYIYVSDNAAPVFGEQQQNFTYECGSEAAIVTPSATDNCSTFELNYTDGEIWVDGCISGFVRTWIATDACGNASEGFDQYISFEDTTEPTLAGCPSDLVLACEDEVPAAAEVTVTDNCDQDITVEYEQFVYGDLPAEGSIADCNLITPARPANNPCVYPYDWAMALFNLPAAHKYYSVSEGSLVQYPDGSIHITATMNNVITPSNGWLVDVWFQGGMDWATWSSQAFPTGFKADCGGIAANHPEWLYYILQASEGAELIGFGAYEGSSLNLVHAPANNYFGFQLGDGANNYNGADNAFGGWFSYSGLFLVNNQPFGMNQGNVSGGGDFAFELDCCPDYWIVRQWTATDCSGNSVTCSQTITFEGSEVVDGPSIVELPVQPELAENGIELSVYPNPAENMTTFKFKTAVTAKTTLELFDMAGAKVADVYNNRVEAGMDYQVDLDVRNLATGVYMFRFSNGENTDMGRLIISK